MQIKARNLKSNDHIIMVDGTATYRYRVCDVEETQGEILARCNNDTCSLFFPLNQTLTVERCH